MLTINGPSPLLGRNLTKGLALRSKMGRLCRWRRQAGSICPISTNGINRNYMGAEMLKNAVKVSAVLFVLCGLPATGAGDWKGVLDMQLEDFERGTGIRMRGGGLVPEVSVAEMFARFQVAVRQETKSDVIIPIYLSPKAAAVQLPERTVPTMALVPREVAVRDALTFICELLDLQYRVSKFGIIIWHKIQDAPPHWPEE
jgi:hypothetical protein